MQRTCSLFWLCVCGGWGGLWSKVFHRCILTIPKLNSSQQLVARWESRIKLTNEPCEFMETLKVNSSIQIAKLTVWNWYIEWTKEWFGKNSVLQTLLHDRMLPISGTHFPLPASPGYGIMTDGYTTFINASTCTVSFQPTNPPIVFDLPNPSSSWDQRMGGRGGSRAG